MKQEVKTKTIYLDLINREYDKKEEALDNNRDIQLQFRRYIEEELLLSFGDGRINKLSTTKMLWDCLEFTPECIKNIFKIMDEGIK